MISFVVEYSPSIVDTSSNLNLGNKGKEEGKTFSMLGFKRCISYFSNNPKISKSFFIKMTHMSIVY